MPTIDWDRVGKRTYESGLDRGVLYLPDGSGIPWNGLTSVVEKPSSSSEQVFFDGMKVNEIITPGDYQATMKAVTYPDIFSEFEGQYGETPGVLYGNQPPKMFNLSYRTFIGNDLDGADAAYKIHILYNLFATPTDKAYAPISDQPSLVEFEWDLNAIPEEITNQRPTAHITIDSRKTDPLLLAEIEKKLYGSVATFPELPSMQDMVTLITDWYRILVVDNGDGTWTVFTDLVDAITVDFDGVFTITGIDAIYLDMETYQMMTTRHAADVPIMAIEVYSDGSWTASTEHDNLISEENGMFTIYNATAIFLGEDMYRISDTE